MTHLLGTARHVVTGVVTLPIKIAARAVGLVRGTASAARRGPSSPWPDTDLRPSSAPTPSPDLGTGTTPVNVTEELGLDPAPVRKPPPPRRTPAVTSIDQQAEPGLVESTPADVARRINGEG